MKHFRSLLHEVPRELRAHLFTTIAGSLLVAAVILVVSLTYGRALTAAQDALAIVDSAGTRTITINLEADTRIPVDNFRALGELSTTSQILFLSSTRDGVNPVVNGNPVGLRTCLPGSDPTLCPDSAPVPRAVTSREVFNGLGFAEEVAAVSDGRSTYLLQETKDSLFRSDRPLAGVIVASPLEDQAEPLSMMVVVVRSSSAVLPTINVAQDLLSGLKPDQYSIDHKRDLIIAGDSIDAALVQSSRRQALLVLMVAGVMLSLTEFTNARSRRKLSGLRRALGANRTQLVGFAALVATAYGLVGALLGSAATLLITKFSNIASPSPELLVAIALVTQFIGIVASLLPAAYSSTRQPARELRTP